MPPSIISTTAENEVGYLVDSNNIPVMNLRTTNTYSDGSVESTIILDTTFKRYFIGLSPVNFYNLDTQTNVFRYYFKKDILGSSRYSIIDYTGEQVELFPYITDRGSKFFPMDSEWFQAYTLSSGVNISMAHDL